MTDIYPVMGDFRPEHYRQIDLSGLHFDNPVMVQTGLANYLAEELEIYPDVKFLYGGYLEKRNFYTGSTLFKNDRENRNIHLGIDVWAPAGTSVYAAEDGQIHSFAYNDGHLDYGAAVIIEYPRYFALYGHLSRASLLGLYPGKPIFKSEQVGELGYMSENGGWVPHLHIQLIMEMDNYIGDFPGLCSESQTEYYKQICPDPGFLVLGR